MRMAERVVLVHFGRPSSCRPGTWTPGVGRTRSSIKGEPRAMLDVDESADLREKLLIEVGNIASADRAARP